MTGTAIPQRDRPIGRELGFLILQTLAPEAGLSNIGWAFECAPDFDARMVERAMEWLLRRHPALRTTFPPDGEGGFVRRTTPRHDVRVELPVVQVDRGRLGSVVERLVARPFDVTRELPLRSALVAEAGAGPAVLVIVVHHIAVDATSAATLLDELDRTYQLLGQGGSPDEEEVTPPEPPAVSVPPASLAYWRDHLAGYDPRDMVLRGHQRVSEPRTFAGHTRVVALDDRVLASLQTLRKQLRATNNILLLGGFYALLMAHGAGPDLTVGTLVTERRDERDRPHVGHKAGMLALRVRAWADISFRDLVLATRQCFFDGMAHADADFDAVLPLIRPADDWRTPVFRQVFTYWPGGISLADADQRLSIGRTVPVQHVLSRYELVFNVMPAGAGLAVKATYSTELFDHDTVDRLLDRYLALVAAAAADPDARVADLLV
ncbi:condensation domain-containing protein [Kutzneria kofuensis]|uniref:Condensation domain-containing protein n=1 Tax=Kutzneria kofuensis TaxID=103725 RepID=A0A7W9NMR5_9PSEU|nr:condensation domain-containing protein [Kutzneria kofuensis]MBB5898119.1 hypothetical protein [Kutzneria kofuensis]